MHITELSIKRPAMMTMVIMLFVVLGLYTAGRIGVELFPAINTPFVSVSVSYPGAGAEEIESKVIKPVEDSLSSLSKLKQITSLASAGRASVTLEFDMTADADEAAIDVQKKIDSIRGRLPDGASDPVVIKRDMNDIPVMSMALSGDRSQHELYDIANDIVKERLQRVDGVTEITIVGGQQREIQIDIDKTKLEGFGLSLNQVISRLQSENLNDPSGRLDRPDAEYNVRVLGEFRRISDISNIELPTSSGYAVPLKDIATISDGYREVRQISRVNGQYAVALQIYKQSDASVVGVGDAVEKALAGIKKDLPEGTELTVARNAATSVKRSLNGTWVSIAEGIITTGLVLFLFLRQWRSTLIVMLAIPTSLIATVMMMYFAGFTFNMVSLMGLALCIGILVDDSIVVLENIHRHRQNGESPWKAAIEGRKEIGMAAVAITLSDVVVFAPIAFMGGMVGQFFRQFGLTVVFATLFSLFVSFTLTPMLSSRLHSNGTGQEKKSFLDIIWRRTIPLGQKVNRLYLRTLHWSLGHRKKVLAFSVLAFFLSLTLIPLKLVGAEFMPQSDQGELSVSLEMPVGTPLAKTDAALKQLEQYLSQIPEVQYYQTTLGSSGGRGGASGANSGRVGLQLYPKGQRDKTVWEVADGIRKWSRGFKEGRVLVSISGGIGGGGGAVQIVVSGKNPDQLVNVADQIKAIVAETPGATDADTNWRLGQPEVQVQVDHRRTAYYGLSVNDVARTVRGGINGETAGTFRDGETEIDMVVRLEGANKHDINTLENLMVTGSRGAVPLGQVAQLSVSSGPTDIRRVNKQRAITVTANVKDRSLNDVMTDIKKEIAGLDLPPGFSVSYGGQDQSMRESFSELIQALVLSIVLVYMILVMLYESFTTPLIRMISLPFGIIGALAILALCRQNLNLFTFIGIIMLDGLAAKNGTLLIDYTHTLMSRGLSLRDALVEAGSTRLKPILMTTITMVFGMLPTALAFTEGAENRRGMALVLIGGLVTSTVFTLYVIPVVYTMIDDWKIRRREKKEAAAVVS
jgi:HAE1 family hydrophobic/amphiphilic exporter-1